MVTHVPIPEVATRDNSDKTIEARGDSDKISRELYQPSVQGGEGEIQCAIRLAAAVHSVQWPRFAG